MVTQGPVLFRLTTPFLFFGILPAADEEAHTAASTNSLSGAITTAAITALVGVAGWSSAYIPNGYRDDRTKRMQIVLDRTAKQLSEFYSPLVQLTEQLDIAVDAQDSVLAGST